MKDSTDTRDLHGRLYLRGSVAFTTTAASNLFLQQLLQFIGGGIGDGALRHVSDVDAHVKIVDRAGDVRRKCRSSILLRIFDEVASRLLGQRVVQLHRTVHVD